MAFDFAREKEIDLAPLFPFESLGEGECLISEKHKKKYKLEAGQVINLKFTEENLWATLEKYFKTETET